MKYWSLFALDPGGCVASPPPVCYDCGDKITENGIVDPRIMVYKYDEWTSGSYYGAAVFHEKCHKRFKENEAPSKHQPGTFTKSADTV